MTLAEFIAAGGSASDNCGLDVPTFMSVSETDNAQELSTHHHQNLIPSRTRAEMYRSVCRR